MRDDQPPPSPADARTPPSPAMTRGRHRHHSQPSRLDHHRSSQHNLPLPSPLAVATEIAPLMRPSSSNQETV
ncbi:unnamed protein product [Linum trigynum]|uniref:Uncharacterized protein n=1 Tax=Linum trigynum TaxID=586398 RepID=A0AAV2FAY7_9ROSI